MMLGTEANVVPEATDPKIDKKPTIKKPGNKKVKDILKDTDFSKFDPITGDKVAGDDEQRRLANMEMNADARKSRNAPSSKEETLKDAATGGSLSFLTASGAIAKGSKRFKGLTAMRKKGIVGLVGAGIAGGLSQKKQKSEYNKQQGARENLAGKETGRSSAYKGMLKRKYDINDNG